MLDNHKIVSVETYVSYDEVSSYEYYAVKPIVFKLIKKYLKDGTVDEEIEDKLGKSLNKFPTLVDEGLTNLSKSQRCDVISETIPKVGIKINTDLTVSSRNY